MSRGKILDGGLIAARKDNQGGSICFLRKPLSNKVSYFKCNVFFQNIQLKNFFLALRLGF